MSQFGYAGKILDVDMSRGLTVNLNTEDYAGRFIGGRGIAAKLYWDKVPPLTEAFDPENCIIFTTGPLAGFPRLGGSRWQVCGKSPAMEPQSFSYANLGGSWGAWLKFSGFDALAIHGRADKPVYLFIHDGVAEIRDASFLTGKDTVQTREVLKAELGKGVRVAAVSPAGENLVSFANVIADEDSSGASGFGSVMGSKNLKAIAVAGNQKPVAAQPERLKELAELLYRMREQQKDPEGGGVWMDKNRNRRKPCYGCTGCLRAYYRRENGEQVKFFCQTAFMYEALAVNYYGRWTEVVVQAVDLLTRYGLDSMVLEPMISWLGKCFREGILDEKKTGLPLSQIGYLEFIETLVRKIAFREGFGDVLAKGTLKAAETVGGGAMELLTGFVNKANELSMYDPRVYIANALLYATEPRRPMQQLHEITNLVHSWVGLNSLEGRYCLSNDDIAAIAERFWGSRVAADYSTYEGKALAAKNIQDRVYAKESLIFCEYRSPTMVLPGAPNQVGDPTIESRIFSAVTGEKTDENGLNCYGERIFNLQRAVFLRDGWEGRQGDVLLDAFYNVPIETTLINDECIVPGKDGKVISRKGAVVDRKKFEEMKSEYYEQRGWDGDSGLPKKNKLEELNLSDIAADLENRQLIK